MLAAGAFYTALVVAIQIEQIFFPGSPPLRTGVFSKLPGLEKGGEPSPDIVGGRINILVMGLDRRPYEGNAATRTDTMFVVTIDPSGKTARGLAMPRDLYVDIPTKQGGSFKERINTAFEYGEYQNYPGGGPALAKATVERLLGIKINHYVVIDFEGFKKVIDEIGGIDVDVAAPGVNDPFYSETERLGDFYPCVFAPGIHHLNGSDALCFSRVRRNSSDLDRIQRQQRVIFAAMDKAGQLKLLADPTNVLSLWKRYKTTIQTDINDFQVLGLTRLAASIDKDHMAFLTLAAVTVSWTTPEGAAVLIPSDAGIKQLVQAFLSDQRLEQEAAVVEVQNGTEKAGQEKRAVDYLVTAGLQKVTGTNKADTSHTRTEIIYFNGKRYTAEHIANAFGLPKDRARAGTDTDAELRTMSAADVLVILGTDAKIESTSALTPGR